MYALDLDRPGAARTPGYSTKSGKSSPLPSISLTHAHISEALLHSLDNGATLDLTKKSLTDVGDSGAEELSIIGRDDLKSVVLRIALGNNRLATLPMGFALLSRLRYLNLKNNSFTVFPEVLTIMPSLDTLDISHNKIKRLPSQPGSLIKLRVFCFSRNKITRLPSYLCKVRHLNILKADRNPIEWPPKPVMDVAGSLDTAQGMKDWVRAVQKWIMDNAPKSELAKIGDESTFSDGHELDNNIEESYNSWSRFPIHERDFDNGVTPHVRSFSIDSNFSISSIPESLQELETSPSSSPTRDRPRLSRLESRSVYSSSISPPRSPDSYLPSPAESADDFTAISSAFPQQHSRNASYAGRIPNSKRKDILAKQSMPDLRTAKLNFAKKVPDLPERSNSSLRELPNSNRFFDYFSIPSPLSQRQDSGSSSGSRFIKPFAQDPVADSPTASDPPVPSMDFERNSYFRRLSSLPSSAVSAALPESLLSLVDSARSILFAVSQVYQTLQHYTVHAIDDRLSSVLRKVLDPASADMMQLINSLDRFDAMSRKMLPPPPVCKSVIENCRDTVAVFGKAVGVLKLQMKVLATRDDVRYLRQMLLVLYGATAEISHAWQAMVPHIDAVKPLLYEHRRKANKSYPIAHSPTRSALPNPGGLDIPFSANSSFPFETAPLRPHTIKPIGETGTGKGVGRIRTARRHAGSFSSRDVELGKKLPSYDNAPFMSGGVISGIAANTATLRAAKRKPTMPFLGTLGSVSPLHSAISSSTVTPALSTARPALTASHSRQGSQTSPQASSASSSPPIPAKASYLEIPSNSRTLVDKEALDAMTVAVEAAPAVWELMDDILADVVDTNPEVRACLAMAKNLTKRLGDNIRAVQQDNATADRKGLREDAHVFVKMVVQLSSAIKTYGSAHPVSSTLRSKMVKLTNSTEEFVILLHVSSFSPSSTPRSYSPMLNGSTPHPGTSGEDVKLGPSLSRSRSAQPTTSSKPMASASRDPPRSALPSQSFVLPAIQRRQGVKAGSVDLDGPV